MYALNLAAEAAVSLGTLNTAGVTKGKNSYSNHMDDFESMYQYCHKMVPVHQQIHLALN